MPSLTKHKSFEYTKLLIEGDSGTGKSGSLASLAGAGYNLRVLDYDNGLESLKQFILHDYPDALDRVDYRTLRDVRRASAAGPIVTAKAFVAGLKMLDNWKYTSSDGEDIDLGKPAEWGPECILVIDSLTFMSDAAYDWAEPLAMNEKGKVDKRQIFGMAQEAIENVLALLTSESFETNVIVMSHIKYLDTPDGNTKAYPTSVGRALSPVIPRYFNTVVQCVTINGRRSFRTKATPLIDLKNPAPFKMKSTFPLGTGLADIFKVLRNPLEAEDVVDAELEDEVKEAAE